MDKLPLALTIDLGTQSLRASLIDTTGNIVAIVKKPYKPPYVSEQKGYAEQDADFYWEYAVDAMTQLCANNKDKLDRIVGATVTSFRDSAVLLDANYKPVRKVILWCDERTAEAKEKLPWLHRAAFAIVGMTDTIELNRKRTMAHWIKENEPSNWSKTKKYVNISTYMTYKLTGVLADSPSGMTGHYPIYYKGKKWYKDGALKGRIFGIPNSMCPALVQSGEVIGCITDEVAEKVGLPKGIKLYATGSDKGCETIGLGALSRDIAAISYGTASTVEVSNQKYYEPEKFLPSYSAAVPGWYNMDVQVYRGYWMINWFAKEFAKEDIEDATIEKMTVEEVLNESLAEIPPGSDGLVLQPYWGPALSRPLGKGAIVGFSSVHTRHHLYRAIIEGIAYALREGLESIENSQGHKVKEIMISGGGSQSDLICQITADVFGLNVSRVQTYETTSLGAATAVLYAAGEFSTIEEAEAAMSHIKDTFIPNELAHQQYEYLYKKVYLQMFPHLKDVYKQISTYDKKYK